LKHFNATLTLSHALFGWNSDSILLSYSSHVDVLSLHPSHGPTSGRMLVLLSVSEAFDNSSAHVCTFDGLNVPVVGYQSYGVFCELSLSFSPGVVQVGLANAVSGELLSDTVPFLFERPLEVAGSVDVARVSRGLHIRVPVKHSSATMDVSCRFGSLMVVKAFVSGSIATCFLSECHADFLSLELSNEGSVWISAGRFRCDAPVSVASVHPLDVSVGQMSVITVVGHNLLQMDGSLLIEVMHQTFPCTRGVVWLCELSVQSAGLQRIRVFHDQHTLFEDDLLARDRIPFGFNQSQYWICLWRIAYHNPWPVDSLNRQALYAHLAMTIILLL